MPAHDTTHTREGRSIIVSSTDEGWAVREEEDGRVLRTVTYTDWHRVERRIHLVTGLPDQNPSEGSSGS